MTSRHEGDRRRILLADDHAAVRMLLAGVLEDSGYDVVQASDGREALDLFEASPDAFSTLVLDIRMPRMTGDEVYRAVRRSHPDLPVVFVSAFGGEVVSREVAEDQAATFVEKPFAYEFLPAAVATVVTRTR